jgi:hypothetical protein
MNQSTNRMEINPHSFLKIMGQPYDLIAQQNCQNILIS